MTRFASIYLLIFFTVVTTAGEDEDPPDIVALAQTVNQEEYAYVDSIGVLIKYLFAVRDAMLAEDPSAIDGFTTEEGIKAHRSCLHAFTRDLPRQADMKATIKQEYATMLAGMRLNVRALVDARRIRETRLDAKDQLVLIRNLSLCSPATTRKLLAADKGRYASVLEDVLDPDEPQLRHVAIPHPDEDRTEAARIADRYVSHLVESGIGKQGLRSGAWYWAQGGRIVCIVPEQGKAEDPTPIWFKEHEGKAMLIVDPIALAPDSPERKALIDRLNRKARPKPRPLNLLQRTVAKRMPQWDLTKFKTVRDPNLHQDIKLLGPFPLLGITEDLRVIVGMECEGLVIPVPVALKYLGPLEAGMDRRRFLAFVANKVDRPRMVYVSVDSDEPSFAEDGSLEVIILSCHAIGGDAWMHDFPSYQEELVSYDLAEPDLERIEESYLKGPIKLSLKLRELQRREQAGNKKE